MRHDPEFHLHLARRQQRRRGTPKSLLGLAICAAAAIGWSLAPEAPPPAATSDIERTLAAPPSATERVAARRFGLCHEGGGRDCVVDGDTFRLDGERIRIADIDTPETHPPRCAEEARLGEAATQRLRALLSGATACRRPGPVRPARRPIRPRC